LLSKKIAAIFIGAVPNDMTRFARGAHFRKLHLFHLSVHSARADGYAIITL